MTDSNPDPQSSVSDFHKKFGFPVDLILSRQGIGVKAVSETGQKVNISSILTNTAQILSKTAAGLLSVALPMQKEGDERAYRVHLLVEELSEVIQAMAERDVIGLADGLTDLSYVTYGTLVTYGLPGSALFEEVHSSNMTKTRDPEDPRMKDKDESRGFLPPSIHKVLHDQGQYDVS